MTTTEIPPKAPCEAQSHDYLLDFNVCMSATIRAKSADEAISILCDILDCATVNCGELPNGDPLLAEATVNIDQVELAMIDGEEQEETV